MSMRILNAKIGMVIFVGIAARFATNDMPIEISTSINKPNALPASMTARIAIGTRIQPWIVKLIASQNSLSSSWFLHQSINFAKKENTGIFPAWWTGMDWLNIVVGILNTFNDSKTVQSAGKEIWVTAERNMILIRKNQSLLFYTANYLGEMNPVFPYCKSIILKARLQHLLFINQIQ